MKTTLTPAEYDQFLETNGLTAEDFAARNKSTSPGAGKRPDTESQEFYRKLKRTSEILEQ